MMQSIRDGAQNWAGVIIAIICVPFAFWGVTSYLGGSQSGTIAEVGDTEITQAEFNREFQYRYREATARGQSVNEEQLKLATFNFLIEQASVQDWIGKTGYAFDDDELRKAIYFDPRYQEGGKFSERAFEQSLARDGLNLEQYKTQRSADLTRNQLSEALYGSVIVTSSEVAKTVRLFDQERQVEYVKFSLDEALAAVNVSEQEVAARYNQDPERYKTDERVKASYIELDQEKLAETIEISDEELQDFFANNIDRYNVPERRNIRHILVETNDDVDDEAAAARAADLSAKLVAGADFAELAAAESDDPGSATEGGSLGWLARGDAFAEPFGDRLFELEVGAPSEPLRTEYGFHIVLVDEAEGGDTPELDTIRDEVVADLKSDLAAERYEDLLTLLRDNSYEFPESLDAAAEAVALPIQQTDWLTRAQGEGVADSADVRAALFDPTVLEDGENTSVVTIGDNKAVVLRLAEREEERQQTLDEVRADIQETLKRQKATRKVNDDGRNLLGAAQEGQTLASLASAQGLKLESPGYIGRDNAELDPYLRDRAFSMPKPEAGKSSVANVRVAGGDFVVIAVTDVRDGNLATLDEDKKSALKERIASTDSRREQVALLLEVRRASNVDMNTQQI